MRFRTFRTSASSTRRSTGRIRPSRGGVDLGSACDQFGSETSAQPTVRAGDERGDLAVVMGDRRQFDALLANVLYQTVNNVRPGLFPPLAQPGLERMRICNGDRQRGVIPEADDTLDLVVEVNA